MRVFLRFREYKLAFIFNVNSLFYQDVKMFNDSLAFQVCVLFTTKTSSSLTVLSPVISLFYKVLPKLAVLSVCMFVLARVPVCLCMHYSVHFVCVWMLSMITTTKLSLSKYWDIYVSVNLLCLIIGLGVWVKFLCVRACVCVKLFKQLIQGGAETTQPVFTSLTVY